MRSGKRANLLSNPSALVGEQPVFSLDDLDRVLRELNSV
jgi:hypothetical protein